MTRNFAFLLLEKKKKELQIRTLSTKSSRQSTWGIPTVVVYRQTGTQATNLMVTQDTDKVLSRFGHRVGVIPTSCV